MRKDFFRGLRDRLHRERGPKADRELWRRFAKEIQPPPAWSIPRLLRYFVPASAAVGAILYFALPALWWESHTAAELERLGPLVEAQPVLQDLDLFLTPAQALSSLDVVTLDDAEWTLLLEGKDEPREDEVAKKNRAMGRPSYSTVGARRSLLCRR